ncbi:lymphokine-activated killer T-cell-originated protein kinase-like [Styela clava]
MSENILQTPVMRFKKKQVGAECQSPCLNMPASPLLQRLGYGTGVSVYLLERSPRQGMHRSPWAVKKVNKSKQKNKANLFANRLKEEANILKSIDHKNIVGFRALSKAKDGMLCLALEDAEKCLFSILEERMEEHLGPLAPRLILKVSSDIASALSYLHTEKQLLHADIKSANVLVKGEYDIIKLCDFGVAIKLDENLQALSSLYVGTESWSAKEAIRGKYVSDRSDIYSYGLVIYEMLSLNIPHFDIFPIEDDFPTEAEYEKAFEEAEKIYPSFLGTRPHLPPTDFGESYQDPIALFYVCTDENPDKRPSAKQIVSSLLSSTQMEDLQCKLNFED